MGQHMLADEVAIRRLIGLGRQQRRLGEQGGLHRQQVAEDAGEGDHHIHARPAQGFERHELRAAEPAIPVQPRLGAHQPERLGDRPALGFEIVRAPQHHRHRLRNALPSLGMASQQPVGLALAVLQREDAGQAERVKTMQIATGGQHLGGAQQIAAGHRADITAIQRVHDRRQLGV